jgi:membrane associated rhomboid family serine protease
MSLPLPPPSISRCYRHPDREAGRSCTRCGRQACTSCLVQANVGSHCLECVKAAQPDLKTKVRYAAAKQHTPVTLAIIAVNVAIFAWMVIKSPDVLGGNARFYSAEQRDFGLALRDISVNHEWYRVISSGFLHFGFVHLGLNMFMLWQLGQLLERTLGPIRFGLLYFAGLLGGSAGVLLLDAGGLTGGASGAVFGLLAGAAIALHRQGINIMQTGIGRALVMNLVLTFAIPQLTGIRISIGGHLGGVVAGGLCGFVMLAPQWKKFPRWTTYLAPVAVSVLALVVSYIVVKQAAA